MSIRYQADTRLSRGIDISSASTRGPIWDRQQNIPRSSIALQYTWLNPRRGLADVLALNRHLAIDINHAESTVAFSSVSQKSWWRNAIYA